MSDKTPTTTLFHKTTSEQEIIHVAKERALENVHAVDQALGESTENPPKKTEERKLPYDVANNEAV
jgi:hypothetical protein